MPCASPVAYAEVSRFRGTTQRASRLCWAACVQSRVAMDRHRADSVDQAALAHRFLAPTSERAELAWLSARADHPCNQPMDPELMVNVWHQSGYGGARWLPLPVPDLGSLLWQQLRKDCPVQVRLEGVHAVLVVAWLRAGDGQEEVYLMDPAPERESGWCPLAAQASTWLDLWVDLEPSPAGG